MNIRDAVQEAMKQALREKEQERLEALRMIKGAILLKDKDGSGPASDEDIVAALRSEIRKRQQTFDLLKEHGKTAEMEATQREIAIIESFLPGQLSREDVEARVRAFLAENPGLDNPGKLTGALKKELGDAVDGKLLNEVCRAVLGA